MLAVPLVAVLGFGAVGAESSNASSIWFARVELINLMAGLATFSFVAVLCYRIYVDVWVPIKREKALNRLLEETEDSKGG
jgi:hypothetical protein